MSRQLLWMFAAVLGLAAGVYGYRYRHLFDFSRPVPEPEVAWDQGDPPPPAAAR
ncbi:MAG: hypothetical protein WD069_01585 [Planctomycetales bacterium]